MPSPFTIALSHPRGDRPPPGRTEVDRGSHRSARLRSARSRSPTRRSAAVPGHPRRSGATSTERWPSPRCAAPSSYWWRSGADGAVRQHEQRRRRQGAAAGAGL